MKLISPMEPVLCGEPFDSREHIFQTKWDGVRCLAYKSSGEIRLFNRQQNERTMQYPELVESLSALDDGTVLDGEIIVLSQSGKPDFYSVLSRDQLRSAPRIKTVAKQLPVQYMVFDIVYHKGKNVAALPLTDRLDLLQSAIRPNDTVHLVDSIEYSGKALFAAVENEGLEGIVAKAKSSPYLEGKKSPLWQKIKAWRVIEALVCGWSVEAGRIRSLLVGVYRGSDLIYIGNIASGIAEREWSTLQDYFEKAYPNYACPVKNPPSAANVRWVRPEISAKVRYMDWSDDAKLRHPVVLDLSWKGD